MRTRMLLIVSLAMLLVPGVLWSMEQSPARGARQPVLSMQPAAPPDGGKQIRIYEIRYYPVRDLEEIIVAVTGGDDVGVVADELGGRLIVTASQDWRQKIEDLIRALDDAAAGGSQAQQMMYRVYMLELPSKGQDLKPFSLVLERSSQMSPAQLLEAFKDGELQISMCRQGDEWTEEGKCELAIQGRAASDETIRRVLEKIPESQMKELRWDDEDFSATIPAAQVTQLPAQLQEHIRRLLGEGVQTVGYWFGNLSLPGEVRAPIGPWMLELNVESAEAGNLELEIRVVREESQIDAIPSVEILSNSVRGRVGKPIIIGYNRDRYGTRTMGAMVIVPEVDTM